MARPLLLVVALLAFGCGDRSGLVEIALPGEPDASVAIAIDAALDRASPKDVTTPPGADASVGDAGSCGFEVTGAAQVSIVGTTVIAEAAGDEIPFIYIDCQGSAGGTVYDFSGQYIPGESGLGGSWLTIGSAPEITNDAVCPAKVLLDGGATTPGEPYGLGEPFAMTFACAFPIDGGAPYDVSAGFVSVRLTSK